VRGIGLTQPRRRHAVGLGAAAVIACSSLLGQVTASQASPLASAHPYTSNDVVVTSSSDLSGYHLFAAHASTGWKWRALATIQPGGDGDDTWVGQQCITGDGTHAVVVLLPRLAVNSPEGRDQGALAYSVNLTTGSIAPLVDGLSAAYFNPGCGVGSSVVLTGYPSADESETRLITVDASSDTVLAAQLLPGEITSAVPVGQSIAAVEGDMVVRIGRDGHVSRLAGFRGQQPYSLRPNAQGGVDLLTTDRRTTTDAWRIISGSDVFLGSGADDTVALFGGLAGATMLLGTPGEPVLPAHVVGASIGGDVLLAGASNSKPLSTAPQTLDAESILIDARSHALVNSNLPELASSSGVRSATALPSPAAGVRGGEQLGQAPFTNTTSPTCAVPRNNLHVQVPQPSLAQVDWGLQQATRNLLSGSFSRKAGYLNMVNETSGSPLAAYQPSVDFPRPSLSGGSASTAVPPQVLEGIFAQESNWDQASYHAARGEAGNPLIADYYGSGTGYDSINYDAADCGYGLGQLTTIMTVSSGEPYAKQDEVAVDYAENVAAAVNTLGNFWNQLYNLNMGANGADPTKLEDWYLAIWAYNTGIHPSDGYGNSGLGWSNNPINPQYPPNRHEFGSVSGDTSHPSDWPYQELVFGWMDYAYSENGNPAYESSLTKYGTNLVIPPEWTFCNATDNCNANDPTDTFCELTITGSPDYYHCWWHESVSFASCSSGQCHAGFFTVATSAKEPTETDPDPPACKLDSSVPSWAVVVGDENLGGGDVNVVGCPQTASGWTSNGTFTVNGTYPDSLPDDEVAAIDFHQLGVGFGGHMWFTHLVPPTDTTQTLTAEWQPNYSAISSGEQYDVKVFIPDSGAADPTALYNVNDGNGGTTTVSIDQANYFDVWVDLGVFTLFPGANITLANNTEQYEGTAWDIGFDAAAFIPEDLTYEGGLIDAPTADVYAIFWNPSPSQYYTQTYSPAIVNFLKDAGQLHEFSSVLSQYYDTVSGSKVKVKTQQFLGSYNDTKDPYPTSGSGTCGTNCISDAGIEQEVQNALATKTGWGQAANDVYLVFTGPNWNVCGPNVPLQSVSCSTPGYSPGMCAYHSLLNPVPFLNPLYYGAIPYPSSANNCQLNSADTPIHDATIDGAIVSAGHEYAETITDRGFNGWCGASGFSLGICSGETEVADKCVDLPYVTQTDSSNGDQYWIQTIWSNAVHACAA
jgi:hypothetical protein